MLLSNSQMVVPGNKSIIFPGNLSASPTSPLDMKFPSPGSSNRYDYNGIGLGIVTALEKSDIRINRHKISSKQNPVCYFGSGSNRSDSVRCARLSPFPSEIDLSEEYTCVTSRNGMTKVYYNDNKFEFCLNQPDGDHCDRKWKKSTAIAVESTAKKREVLRDSPDFLSWCCLCKKELQGKDIYMYKGDKGFCSKECRSVIIMEDNLKVQHKSISVEVLSSPYVGGQISSAGIFVL